VISGAGIVVLTEPAEGACEVLAYGPRVRPVFERAAKAVTDLRAGYVQTENGEDAKDIFRTFERIAPTGEKVIIELVGGEPGMEGRQFRYPLMNAFVKRSGAAPAAPPAAGPAKTN
jgi:hypothetical protein